MATPTALSSPRFLGAEEQHWTPLHALARLSKLGRFLVPALLIHVSLASGPKHGRALTEDGEAIAGVRLAPGTLYGALARLEARGLIEALPTDEGRRPYRLAGAGAATP